MLNLTHSSIFLLAYLGVLYVRPHEYLPSLMGLPILPVLLVASTVFWLAKQTKDWSAPQFKLLPAQTLLMAWSVLLSGWAGGAISTVTEFFPVVLLFYMLATSIDSVAKVKEVFTVLAVAMIIISLHSIQQADEASEGIGWTGAQMVDGRVTYLGFLNDPNDLSMAILMILPMQLYLARKSGVLFKIFWYGAVFLSLYAIKLTNSRGAVLALGAMLMHFGVLRYGFIRSIFVAPFLLLPIIILGPSRMNEIDADEESAEGRIDAWHEGFQMLIHHPLFGVGKGMFTEYNYLTAHNSYVLAMAELGLVGYFVWLSSIVLSVLMAKTVFFAEPKALPEKGPKQYAPILRNTTEATQNRFASNLSKLSSPAKATTGQIGDPAAWHEVHEASTTLWYGFTGALVAIFFLSRSYVPILYIHMALMIAMYQLALKHKPNILKLTFADWWQKLLGMALGSTVGLWLLTAILLRT